jgi:cytochrome c
MSDSLTFNKVAGAALATLLLIFGLKELTAIVFHPHELEKPGYKIEVVETAEGGAAAEAPPDWGTVLPTANVAAGQAVSAKCVSCHTFTPGGANGTGPNLYGVLGRKPGSHAGFAYSPAMVQFGADHPVWDYQQLDEFTRAPQKHINGTKMTFVGIKPQADRINLMAYLHSLGSTLPIPAPNPAAAAPPAAEGGEANPAEGAAPAGAPVATGSAAPAPAQTPAAGPAAAPAQAPAKTAAPN